MIPMYARCDVTSHCTSFTHGYDTHSAVCSGLPQLHLTPHIPPIHPSSCCDNGCAATFTSWPLWQPSHSHAEPSHHRIWQNRASLSPVCLQICFGLGSWLLPHCVLYSETPWLGVMFKLYFAGGKLSPTTIGCGHLLRVHVRLELPDLCC